MVVMGRIVAAQGLLGWVKVQAFTEHLDTLIDYDTWQIGNDNHPWQEVQILECKLHTKVLVAKLDGINDRTAAEKCKGLLVAVPRSSLPKEGADEYYWSDLIGMSVFNLENEYLGKVDHLLDMGANDILCVQNDKVEVLIPFLKHVIQQVNQQEKLIRVDWQADY